MNPEAYSETYQTSQMEVFAKVVNDFDVSEIPVAWKNSLCNKILRDLLVSRLKEYVFENCVSSDH